MVLGSLFSSQGNLPEAFLVSIETGTKQCGPEEADLGFFAPQHLLVAEYNIIELSERCV